MNNEKQYLRSIVNHVFTAKLFSARLFKNTKKDDVSNLMKHVYFKLKNLDNDMKKISELIEDKNDYDLKDFKKDIDRFVKKINESENK